MEDSFLSHCSLYMDVYTIAKSLYYRPNTNKKIIYVGHDHLSTYYKFFSFLGVQNINFFGMQHPNILNPNRCITINRDLYIN